MSANFDDLIAQRALATATPGTLPLVRRSAYLADALRNLEADGSKANYASAWALPANLLADALLQRQSTKANADLATAQTADQQSLLNASRSMLGPSSPPSAPDAASDAAAQSVGAAPAPPMQTAAAPPVSLPTFADTPAPSASPGAPMSDADRRALALMTWGEARGEGADGQRAVASVALNRARAAGLPVSAIVSAPHQFAGYGVAQARNPSDAQLAPILANIGGLADGSMPPTTTADHFYAPAGMPGGRTPAWAQGQAPQVIGHQNFYTLNRTPPPQMAQVAPQSAPQGDPTIQPYQVASIGPTPGPPMNAAAAGALSPQAQQAPPAPTMAGGATPSPAPSVSPAAQPNGPPTGLPATPQERVLFERLAADPRTMPQAMEMARSIAQRQATPLAPPKGFMWGPDGKAAPIPGTTSTSQAGPMPGSFLETDPLGHHTYVTPPTTYKATPGVVPYTTNVTGSDGSFKVEDTPGGRATPPAGTMYDPRTGGYSPVAQPRFSSVGAPGAAGGAAPGRQGLVPLGSLIQHDPVTGEVKTDPRLGPANDIVKEALSAPEVTEYSKLSHAYGGITSALAAAQRNNGSLDTSFVDAQGQVINPGRAMTVGSTKLWLQHYGLPEELAGHVASIFGNGYLTPKTMSDGLSVMNAYAKSAHDQAATKLGHASDALAGFGVTDPRLQVDSVPAVPNVGWLNGGRGQSAPPGGAGGAGAGTPGGPQRLSPAQAAALPKGAGFYGLDGRWRIRQ